MDFLIDSNYRRLKFLEKGTTGDVEDKGNLENYHLARAKATGKQTCITSATLPSKRLNQIAMIRKTLMMVQHRAVGYELDGTLVEQSFL